MNVKLVMGARLEACRFSGDRVHGLAFVGYVHKRMYMDVDATLEVLNSDLQFSESESMIAGPIPERDS